MIKSHLVSHWYALDDLLIPLLPSVLFTVESSELFLKWYVKFSLMLIIYEGQMKLKLSKQLENKQFVKNI